jgi:GNAT superfamily N-acetyltransferase
MESDTVETKSITNLEMIPYLAARGLFSLFPLYVCQQRPEAVSHYVLTDAEIQGCLVTGKYCGIDWIHSHWLIANDKLAMLSLLKHLRDSEGEDVGLNFPLEFHDEVQSVFPDKTITVDHLYALIPSRFHARNATHPIRLITEELLSQVIIPQEMTRLIGSDHKPYNGIPFFGIVIDNQLVSIGEAICDTGTYAAIQQVYTVATHRGLGLGSMVVSSIAADLIGQKKTPVYWVAEDNDSSIRLVQKLGFDLVTRLGCVEG